MFKASNVLGLRLVFTFAKVATLNHLCLGLDIPSVPGVLCRCSFLFHM